MPRDRQLFVAGLPNGYSEEQFQNIFKCFGPLELACVTGDSKGKTIGFVTYIDAGHARDAETCLHGKTSHGAGPLVVVPALSRSEKNDLNQSNGKDPSIVRKLQAAMESTAPNTLAGMKQTKTGQQHKYPAGGNTPGTIGVSAIAPVPVPAPVQMSGKGNRGNNNRGHNKHHNQQQQQQQGGIIDRLISAGMGAQDVATMMTEEKPKNIHELAVQYPHHVQMEASLAANANSGINNNNNNNNNKRGKHHNNQNQHHHHHHHQHQHTPQQNPLEKKISELEKELLNLKAVAASSGSLLNFQQQQQLQQQQQRVAQPSPLLAGLQAKSLQPTLPNTTALGGVGGLGQLSSDELRKQLDVLQLHNQLLAAGLGPASLLSPSIPNLMLNSPETLQALQMQLENELQMGIGQH